MLRDRLKSLRWPMWYRLRGCDLSLMQTASQSFDMHWDYDASPDWVHRNFFGFLGDEPWAPGFQGVGWVTPEGRFEDAIMDEFYSFMAMRVRVIEHVPACRSVAVVERWSLPLATEMLQVIETFPLTGGRTRLRYRVFYNVPRPFLAFHPAVAVAFRAWFQASFRGLEAYLARHPEPAAG